MDDTILECKANDTTMDDELYELVRSRLEAEAGEEAVDSGDTFEEVHRRVRARFWLRCEEFLKTPEGERTAWQKACVGIYFTLKNPRCPFVFGGEEAEETFEYLDRQAAAGQGPGGIYKAIKKHGDGAIRLARLRALSLQTIRAESQRRIESQGGHTQSVEMEGDLANAVHCFFRDLGVSGHTHGEPLAWLTDGVDLMRLCPASEDGWVKAQRRMEKYSKCGGYYPANDAEHRERDKEMLEQLRGKYASWLANSSAAKFTDIIVDFVRRIGLKMDRDPSNRSRPVVNGIRVDVTSCCRLVQLFPVKGIDLAGAVLIVTKDFRARAAHFPVAFTTDEFDRGTDVSHTEGAEEPEEPEEPSHTPREPCPDSEPRFDCAPFPDCARELEFEPYPYNSRAPSGYCAFNADDPCYEGFDAAALDDLLAELERDSKDRYSCLASVSRAVERDKSNPVLLREHSLLRTTLDWEVQLRALRAALPERDDFGRRWLAVRYERRPGAFGRRRPAPCSEPASVTTRTLAYDEDPRARQRRTTIGYTGLPASLCAVLAGRTPYGGAPRLSIVRVPWVSLVVHGAHIGSSVCARSIPTLTRVAANYEDVLGELCDHYFGDRGERAMGAVRTLLDAHVHGAVTHEAWARWYAPTSDESAPVLRGVRAESMVVQDAVWQGWATRRDVQMETADMADTHAGDREKRQAVWIRWLQRLEANVLERVEVKLHETRRVLIDEHWGCRDVWRAFEDRLAVHEVLERYRPLCPVAFVPGGLLVEDARCTATPPASPRPRKRRRMREGSPPELQHGSDGGPSPADCDLLDEAPDDCFDGWAAEDALELRHEFERTVIFADGAYLPDIVARVAEEVHGVVLQAMPLDANVLPPWELSRAREIVQKYSPASQFQGDAEFGGGASS
ncbi:hypothetical protein AB1Y20_012698 [Prymnesium parvum]|uniref:Uncharacterized protein n=1 Tax=Prymnesium parvum TaxID=97485 RepID=A0AB34IM57_PRYPA